MARLALLLLLSGFFFNGAYSQDKFEKEYRIKKEAVPEKALDFMGSIAFEKKIKWYKEEGLTTNTFEAKTRYNGLKYSIEFDSIGNIEDVEYEIEWKDIPPNTQSAIELFLDSTYQKSKIRKVQVQLTGTVEELLKSFTPQNRKVQVTTKYEIVLKVKTEKKYQMMEYLFSETGEMERKSKIILKNTDNLEF